jgi:hypothetical protein
MPDINGTEAIFIQEAIVLPAMHSVESEKFLPGWRVVKNLDSDALARSIEDANWHSFYLAGKIKATVLGLNRPGTLRRAVKSVLAKQRLQKFNCLEVTGVVSKRFLGIPFVSITAHSRHVQRGFGLVPAKDFTLQMPIATSGETAARQSVDRISSS